MKIDKRSHDRLNFGDDLNNWLWPRLMPECLDDDDGIHFLGIGTLLKQRRFERQLSQTQSIVIFSSGSWGVDLPKLDRRCYVYGVRGPRTAKALGLEGKKVLGDGAYLLRNVINAASPAADAVIGFIPHHGSERYVDWRPVCEAAGVKFISARQPVDSFLSEISECSSVIAEAMHGAITADLLRIPWVATRFASNFNEEKWLDWAESMSMELSLHQLPITYHQTPPFWKSLENRIKRALKKLGVGPKKWAHLPSALKTSSRQGEAALIAELKSLAETAPRQMSSDASLDATVDRLNAALNQLRQDYREGKLTPHATSVRQA